jgi:uncharacterized membrane protein YphA (DoxX/SURF4 family)
MKLKSNTRRIIIDSVCLLYMLLFVYAAVSKLLDFENFQVQLGQSPLLSPFAAWISWIVPFLELVIALMLMIPKRRNAALLTALSLMMMFTVYIFIVLHYSSFIPCSCGGILEKMSWNTHLVFNFVFVLLAIFAIVLQHETSGPTDQKANLRMAIVRMVISLLASTSVVIVLFFFSEKIMQYENPFIRRYAPHPVMFKSSIDLKYNSFYFAGQVNEKIYLGNYTNPLQMSVIDSRFKSGNIVRISFDPKKIPFQMVTVKVRGNYFYIIDGRVPAIFRGSTRNWKINKEFHGVPYFSLAEPIDSITVAFRSNNGKNLANILGIYNAEKRQKIQYRNSLLQKQIDGVFDTDGMLFYSEKINKIVYLYFYRNEFIVAEKTGKLDYRGHTIDTTTRAKIKVSYLKNNTQRKMSAPPFIVNANVAVCQNLLFVQSRIKGRFENKKLWQQASIVDVYDLRRKAYLLSFPVYNIGQDKMESFVVTEKFLYAIIGNQLAQYELKSLLKKEMKHVGLKESDI